MVWYGMVNVDRHRQTTEHDQVKQHLINKGNSRTFNTNNEKKKQYSEEKKTMRRKNSTMKRNDRSKYTETNID